MTLYGELIIACMRIIYLFIFKKIYLLVELACNPMYMHEYT